jgi:hypothetical protein
LTFIATVLAAALAATLVFAVSPKSAPAQSGEVQICHYTGDPDRLYVLMTVSGAALEAHNNHDNDIIPAPPSGCPSTVPPVDPLPTPVPSPTPYVMPPTTASICHAIGGALYQQLEIPLGEVGFHQEHERDIIPAPAGGCPNGALPDDSGDEEDEEDDAPRVNNSGGLRPTSTRSGANPANATGSLPMLTDTSRGIQGIPYTGARPDVLLLLGLSLLMAGTGARLLLRD